MKKIPCFSGRMQSFGQLAAVTIVLCWGQSCLASEPAVAETGQKRPVVEECRRCHDVDEYLLELKSSSHAHDKDKKPISCEQCHHFHFNPLTGYYARDEYYDKKIFKPEDFDRRKMQKTARASIEAEKCRACHKDLYVDVKGGPISEIGRLSHDAFLKKNGETRRTCAGCHINIAHLSPFDEDLQINAEFVEKLKKSRAAQSGEGGGQ